MRSTKMIKYLAACSVVAMSSMAFATNFTTVAGQSVAETGEGNFGVYEKAYFVDNFAYANTAAMIDPAVGGWTNVGGTMNSGQFFTGTTATPGADAQWAKIYRTMPGAGISLNSRSVGVYMSMKTNNTTSDGYASRAEVSIGYEAPSPFPYQDPLPRIGSIKFSAAEVTLQGCDNAVQYTDSDHLRTGWGKPMAPGYFPDTATTRTAGFMVQMLPYQMEESGAEVQPLMLESFYENPEGGYLYGDRSSSDGNGHYFTDGSEIKYNGSFKYPNGTALKTIGVLDRRFAGSIDGCFTDAIMVTEIDTASMDGYMAGDGNYDGYVDIFDVLTAGENYGYAPTIVAGELTEHLAPRSLGDSNGDGYIDIFDVLLTGENYGHIYPGPAADESPVPEPTTLAMLGIGSLLALRRRRA